MIGNRLVLRFEGVEDRGAAEALVGLRLFLEEREIPPLPEGEYYAYDLVGLELVDRAGQRLGRVAALESGGNREYLVVEGEQGGGGLIPLVDVFVRRVDLEAGRIVVDLPEGLLDGATPPRSGPGAESEA
jgi:16S rRNA processing protein RimM